LSGITVFIPQNFHEHDRERNCADEERKFFFRIQTKSWLGVGMFTALLEVIIGPQWLKVGEVKAAALIARALKIESAAWDNMVNVPLAVT
jgi:hypothetical protein